jgi:phosphatidylserine/phosphatidylglycerophosphate/cardiolipin synthase-like enzyme
MIRLLFTAAVAGCLSVLLAACALVLPPQGVNQPGVAGIDDVMQRYGVAALHPETDRPLLRQTLDELAKTDPLGLFHDVTYGLSEGNRLPPAWLVQTPNVWGQRAAGVPVIPLDCPGCDADLGLPPCSAGCPGRCAPLAASAPRPGARPGRFCLGHSDAMIDAIYQLVISAQQSVDVTLLQPSADHRFLAALRNGLTRLAYSGRKITVRVLVGNYPPDGTDPLPFLKELVRDAAVVPNSKLAVYAATLRSCELAACGSLSWNHAKIVAVDGRRALVGGHNMWTQDYLLAAPVHDLSMRVEGPAARAAQLFANALWRFVCAYNKPGSVNESYDYQAGSPQIGTGCQPTIPLPAEDRSRPGTVPILSVARLGSGIVSDFADQSQVARTLLLGAARQTIRMVQQDVGFTAEGLTAPMWPDSDIERLADLIAHGGDVYMVLSNLGASSPTGDYSTGVTLEQVAGRIHDALASRSGLPEPDLDRVLCNRLHLAPMRFGPDPSWPGDKPIGVHAKFWMVDDRVFYIGSENLYPVDLQEFGYIVDSRTAAAEIRRDYFDKAWTWSKEAAISGTEAQRCVFLAPKPR